MKQFLIASDFPLEAIAKVTYEGQSPKHRKYRSGYEHYFNSLPVPRSHELAEEDAAILSLLAKTLSTKSWIMCNNVPNGEFERTILAIADHSIVDKNTGEGEEVIIAEWGKGYHSPAHGHKHGLLHEELIQGKMLVSTYRIINRELRIARLIESKIYNGLTPIVSTYTEPDGIDDRSAYVHSFTALEPSVSLHYVPEHTRDGRDNSFNVDSFTVNLQQVINISRGNIRKGDIILTRCKAGKDYGDHFVYITGDNGEHKCFIATGNSKILDIHSIGEDTYLRLDYHAREKFLWFHDIKELVTC